MSIASTALEIQTPGLVATIQDQGRAHGQHLGLAQGGAVDPFAYSWANHLCNNAPNLAAIEITLGGFAAIAQKSCVIALTGADSTLSINGVTKPCWCAHLLGSGDHIAITAPRRGCRNYLAIQGGFSMPLVFGSRATVVREKLGGVDGRALCAGDTLDSPAICAPHRCWQLPAEWHPNYPQHLTLRVILGYQDRLFSRTSKRQFFRTSYILSGQSDRMGCRLNGPAIEAPIQGILSEGLTPGAIQILGDGQPIVLLNDCQTIGGYPKIGSVIANDVALLSQLQPGGKVNFAAISLAQAASVRRMHRVYEHGMRAHCIPLHG